MKTASFVHSSSAFTNKSLVKPETRCSLLVLDGNKVSATVLMASLRGMFVYRLTISKEHMVMLFGMTVFFSNFATLN